MADIEIIATVRCKTCGDIISLEVPLEIEEAAATMREFKDKHKHVKPGPWVI